MGKKVKEAIQLLLTESKSMKLEELSNSLAISSDVGILQMCSKASIPIGVQQGHWVIGKRFEDSETIKLQNLIAMCPGVLEYRLPAIWEYVYGTEFPARFNNQAILVDETSASVLRGRVHPPPP